MIVGASPIEDGSIFSQYPPSDYFVICADAGYETALKFKVTPDLIVGDFDSAAGKPPKSLNTITIPVKKDVTDTMYAVMQGIARGFSSFVLLGCLGGARFDHSIANLEVLEYLLEQGARGALVDEHTQVLLLRGSRLRLSQMKGTIVSVFPYRGSSCNVSYEGLLYPLSHSTLTCAGTPMGVSNSVISDEAEISVHVGTALVILYRP